MITFQEAVKNLRPETEWTMSNDDVESIIWHTENVVPLTKSEVDAEIARLTALEPIRIATENRKAAYIAEADPLFFKAQRGEATLQEWQDKVAEIKARFPKD